MLDASDSMLAWIIKIKAEILRRTNTNVTKINSVLSGPVQHKLFFIGYILIQSLCTDKDKPIASEALVIIYKNSSLGIS